MLDNIGGCMTVEEYVRKKILMISPDGCDFEKLYSLMFSETDNVMYEKSSGYRIEKTTYGQCREQIDAMSDLLYSRLCDLPEGSNVGLYMENSLSWIKVFWSILKCGFCPVLMNLRLDGDTLEKIISDVNIAAVVSDKNTFSVKTVFADSLTGTADGMPSRPFGKYVYVMSSGTSDSVKVCAYSAKQFYCQIKASYGIITESKLIQTHYEGELKLLTFLPFYHIFGLVAVYIWFAFFSRTFVELPDLTPYTLLNTVRRHKVTHIFAVPLFWNKIYEQTVRGIRERGEKTEKKFRKGMKISQCLEHFPILYRLFSKIAYREIRGNLFGDSIMFMITGGSEIKPETIRFFNAVGYRLANGYGMTEIGITSVELSDNPSVICSASVGHPMVGVEFKLGEHGELYVKGDCISEFIIENGERHDNDGWLDTGDCAEVKGERYYICGRRDDTVISPAGENLNPNIIEPKFYGIKGVKEVCLIGSEKNNETEPVLLIETEKYIGENAFLRLKAAANEKLTELSMVSEIHIVFTKTQLIPSSQIKINRHKAARRYQNGEIKPFDLSVTEKEAMSDEIYCKLREIFASALSKSPEEIVGDYDFFTDGGGTSLDYFAMISEILGEFSIGIPTYSNKTVTKITEIYDYIVRKHDE